MQDSELAAELRKKLGFGSEWLPSNIVNGCGCACSSLVLLNLPKGHQR